MPSQPSPNFAYLAHHDARLVALATQAEEAFATAAIVTLGKLRQVCKVLAERTAVKVGELLDPHEELIRIKALHERTVAVSNPVEGVLLRAGADRSRTRSRGGADVRDSRGPASAGSGRSACDAWGDAHSAGRGWSGNGRRKEAVA